MTTFSLEAFARECVDPRAKLQASYRQVLGIQLTRACPVGCAHCIFSCTGEGEDLPLPVVGRILAEWREIPGAEGVGLTGGEPFSRRKLLKFAVDRARSLGLKVRVATSAYWANTPNAARAILKDLVHLSELVISVDRWHQQMVSPRTVANALDAARELGIVSTLMVTVGEEGLLPELAPLAPYLENRLSPKDIRVARMFTYGRADHSHSEPLPANAQVACGGMNVPLLGADGELSLCCVPPATGGRPALLCRGSVFEQSLGRCFSEDDCDYWLLQALRAVGPQYLAQRQGLVPGEQYCAEDVCQNCIRLWSDSKSYHAARSLAEEPEFREDVAWRLHRRGDSAPLVRYYSEAALGQS